MAERFGSTGGEFAVHSAKRWPLGCIRWLRSPAFHRQPVDRSSDQAGGHCPGHPFCAPISIQARRAGAIMGIHPGAASRRQDPSLSLGNDLWEPGQRQGHRRFSIARRTEAAIGASVCASRHASAAGRRHPFFASPSAIGFVRRPDPLGVHPRGVLSRYRASSSSRSMPSARCATVAASVSALLISAPSLTC